MPPYSYNDIFYKRDKQKLLQTVKDELVNK